MVGSHQVSLKVRENNTSATITQDFNITVQEVNDAPTFEGNRSTKTIEYETNSSYIFTIADGDANAVQSIDGDVSSSNSSIVSVSKEINATAIKIIVHGADIGESNITVTLQDDNGTDNGGVDTTQFSFKVIVRATGWKIYDKRKQANNNSEHNVTFDSRIYQWNISKQWYEDTTNNTILMPVNIIQSQESVYLSGNFEKVQDGHYYVNKAEYLWDSNKSTGHTSTTKYRNADGDENNITAQNDNFQHDAYHNFFVSMIVKDDTNVFENHIYTEWTNTTTNFVLADDLNHSYATAESYSQYYVDNSDSDDVNYNIYVDANNTSESNTTECALNFGVGWRIPTAYEVGVHSDDKSAYSPLNPTMTGYIPSYAGGSVASPFYIFTSTQYASEDANIVLKIENATWAYVNNTSTSKLRCIYQP
jgi:hypothetical protein